MYAIAVLLLLSGGYPSGSCYQHSFYLAEVPLSSNLEAKHEGNQVQYDVVEAHCYVVNIG